MVGGAEYIIENCIEACRKKVLIIFDSSTEDVMPLFEKALSGCNKKPSFIILPVTECHGKELPQKVQKKIMDTDAVMCITKYSFAHTDARRKAAQMGIPFLSMPDYNKELLNNPAIFADYKNIRPLVQYYTDILTRGKNGFVTSEMGTELFLDLRGRNGNCCPGLTDKTFLLGSPPDIEANISPIESATFGKIVVDGSVTDRRIGLLTETLTLYVENGYITRIESENKETEEIVKNILNDVGKRNAYIVGELGIGFNDKAELCGNMLVDEGTRGCVHFGIGSNWTIGGKNQVEFHLDFVMKNANLRIDDEIVMERGALLYG